MRKLLITLLGSLSLLPATLHADSAKTAADLYSLQVQSIDGTTVSMADYKGKTLLIVNTASQCGYTPQYEGLQSLYSKYKDKGLVVLGFPSNDFGGQEPGTNTEIKKFCKTRYKVDFPMFAKGPVKGAGQQPLFAYLTKSSAQAGDIQWNFEKFLIAPNGKTVGRFGSRVAPEDAQLVSAIEQQLPKK